MGKQLLESFEASSPPDGRIGTHVGPYAIRGLLGCGAMGRIYEAVAANGRSVALKMLREELSRNEIARCRFELEARIATVVRNPRIVPVLDTGEHDGTPYLVAQLIEGGSLKQLLGARGPLEIGSMLRIGADVAEGLEALWGQSMIHRDVKPGNILLDHCGRAYLTDFGLAKHDAEGTALTLPGQTLGSLPYMAPEQIRGEQSTPAADVYSLACVMFECLQGRPPFGERGGIRVLWAHLSDSPPDPVAGREDASPELGEVLLTALAKDPSDRPDSARDYIAALAAAAGVTPAQPTSA